MKKKFILSSVLIFIVTVPLLYAAAYVDSVLRKTAVESYQLASILKGIRDSKNMQNLFLSFLLLSILGIVCLVFGKTKSYKSDQIIVTPEISIPVPAGQGQCGTARWLKEQEFDHAFGTAEINKNSPLYQMLLLRGLEDIKEELQKLKQHGNYELVSSNFHDNINDEEIEKEIFKRGGVVIGKKDVSSKKEKIYFISEDVHTLVIGATGSGKTRTLVIQTILCLAFAGESMILTDIKGELYEYVSCVLRLLDYHIVTLDFKNPRKSSRYNFLQPIIDCISAGDIPGAVDATWDLTSQLVGEAKGEKLWTDGESSTIAAGIMAVVYDNREPENQKYQNLTNVYYFISQMCTPVQVGNNMIIPLNRYVKDLPANHPSKGLLSIGEIAPNRTRASFYTAVLMTLRLFTNPLIADMTSCCDFNSMEIGEKKTAIFIILPDDRKTYHSLASLYVTQQYQLLSKAADERGGRLNRRTNFICDEFGNFVKIPIFSNMLTVSRGKGIRFNLFLQGFSQLEEVYEKEVARTIKGNCENWVYLQTDDPDTLKEISEKLGKYTITTYSLSSSHAKYTNPSSGENVSLTGRELLMANEVKSISRPYSLVTSRKDPAILYAPDLLKWGFNEILGLGDKEHNRMVRLAREQIRIERVVSNDVELWGIWDKYIEIIMEDQQKLEEERQMMLELAKQMAGKNQ